MEFLSEYGLFLAQSVTVVIAILVVLVGVLSLSSRGRGEQEGHIEVKAINDKFDEMEQAIKAAVLKQGELKKLLKESKKKHKAEQKKTVPDEERRQRVYVLSFNGDMKASAVDNLREEVTAVLTMADPRDEVVLRLESPGGLVHTYGLAASQLQRIRAREIPLTVAVDTVAASGGYLMACIADKIIAAPFAILGSIGVLAQLPNFHRLLKKNDIDFELLTAGEYKRTLTMFGENTDKGRQKFLEELEDTHDLFKNFVSEHRPQVNIGEVATGEIWYGRRALAKNLIDDILTSDEYLLAKRKDSDIYAISYQLRKTLPERLGLAAESSLDRLLTRWIGRFTHDRHF